MKTARSRIAVISASIASVALLAAAPGSQAAYDRDASGLAGALSNSASAAATGIDATTLKKTTIDSVNIGGGAWTTKETKATEFFQLGNKSANFSWVLRNGFWGGSGNDPEAQKLKLVQARGNSPDAKQRLWLSGSLAKETNVISVANVPSTTSITGVNGNRTLAAEASKIGSATPEEYAANLFTIPADELPAGDSVGHTAGEGSDIWEWVLYGNDNCSRSYLVQAREGKVVQLVRIARCHTREGLVMKTTETVSDTRVNTYTGVNVPNAPAPTVAFAG